MRTGMRKIGKRFGLVAIGGFLLLTAFTAGAAVGGGIKSKDAQSAIIQLFGGKYPKEHVHVRRVVPGFSSSDAIVEAQIDATFNLKQTPDGWKVTEIRVGDRDWRKVEEFIKPENGK